VRLRGGLLILAGCAALVHAFGVVTATVELQARGGAVAFAALAGYVAVAGGSVRSAVRWPLAAGAALLAVMAGAGEVGYGQSDFGWFSYGPSEDHSAFLRETSQRWMVRERWNWLATLLALCCLLAAVVALPRRGRRGWGVATVAAGAVILALPLGDLASVLVRPTLSLVTTAWLPVMGVLAGAAVVVLAGRRAGTSRLVAAGAVLFGLSAATGVGQAIRTVEVLTPSYEPLDGVQMSVAIAVSSEPLVDLWALLGPGAQLLGTALIAVGAVRAGTATDPDTAPTPP